MAYVLHLSPTLYALRERLITRRENDISIKYSELEARILIHMKL